MPKAWLDTKEAAKALDLTPRQLNDLRRSGLLKVSKHCRDRSRLGSSRPTWQYHIKRCEEALAIPSDKRA